MYPVIFITGGVILVLEILGSRLIIPFFGNTIFVWSSLISVTIGALALGYWLGGKTADRYGRADVFYFIIFLAGFFINFLLIFKIKILIFSDVFGVRFGPLIASGFLFFLPLFALGMTSPFVIRLKTKTIEDSGKISGLVFAVSTLGSLFGGLLAGFFLVQFSTMLIIKISGLILIFIGALGMFFAREKISNKILLIFSIIIAIFSLNGFFKTEQKEFSKVKIDFHQQSFYGDLKVISFKEAKAKCLL